MSAAIRAAGSPRSLARRMTQLYGMVTAIHKVLLHARDEATLTKEACDLAVSRGGYLMAWIGAVDAKGTHIDPLASAGAEQGYLRAIRIATGDEPEGRGPTGTAVRTGHHVVCNDIATDARMTPWRDQALARGYRSNASFPLTVDGRAVGAFTVYAPAREHFGQLEVDAMDELAADIGYSIQALRSAEQGREAEEALRGSQRRLKELNEELEARVAARTAELEFANQELESFAYSVSHDLRAPLRAMVGFSKALRQKQGPYLDADAQHYIERIEANAAHMGRLIEELLRFSRASRSELKAEKVEPAVVVERVMVDLRESANQAGVEVDVAPMPPCVADPFLLQQVYANLIDNAIKFSRGRPRARVSVGAHVEKGDTVYDVCDNGVGFDMRYADKLFGVFQRLHTQAEFEGVGVGLALVQRIVHRHGGRIWAEAELGKGASFHFTLGGSAA